MERVEILSLPLPDSHLQLATFISYDAIVVKQLCYVPLVVPVKTADTNVAFSFSSESKCVLLLLFRMICLSMHVLHLPDSF